MFRQIIWIITMMLLLTGLAVTQDQTQNQPGAVIKHVPVSATSAASGKEMFTSYCAACHGTDGKGYSRAGGQCTSQSAHHHCQIAIEAPITGGGKYRLPAVKFSDSWRFDYSCAWLQDMPVRVG